MPTSCPLCGTSRATVSISGAELKTYLENGVSVSLAWLLVPITIAAVAGFYLLRRATPKN